MSLQTESAPYLQQPLSPKEMASLLSAFQYFLTLDQAKIAALRRTGSFPNLKGYRRAGQLATLKLEVAHDLDTIYRLRASLDHHTPLTYADLGFPAPPHSTPPSP